MVQCKDPCNPTADEIKACLCDPDCCKFVEQCCPKGCLGAVGAVDWSAAFALALAIIDAVKQWLAQQPKNP